MKEGMNELLFEFENFRKYSESCRESYKMLKYFYLWFSILERFPYNPL